MEGKDQWICYVEIQLIQ